MAEKEGSSSSGHKGVLKSQLQILKKPSARRSDQDLKALVSSFSRVKFFQELAENLQIQVCRFIQLDKAIRDTAVFKEGEAGDKFYLILSGSVGVYIEEVEARDADSEVRKSVTEEAVNPLSQQIQAAQMALEATPPSEAAEETPHSPRSDSESSPRSPTAPVATTPRAQMRKASIRRFSAIVALSRGALGGGGEEAAPALPTLTEIAEDAESPAATPRGSTLLKFGRADMSDPEIKAYHAYVQECGRTGRRNAATGHAMLAAKMAVRRPSQQMVTFRSLDNSDSDTDEEGEEEEDLDDDMIEEEVEEEVGTDDDEVEADKKEASKETEKKDSEASDNDVDSDSDSSKSSSSASSTKSETVQFKLGQARADSPHASDAAAGGEEEDAEGPKREPLFKAQVVRRQSTWKKLKPGLFRQSSGFDQAPGGVKKLVEIKILKAGEYFGEIALQTDEPRKATVKTKEETIFATLTRADYKAILQGSWQKQQEERHAFLKSIPLLSGVAEQGIQKLSAILQKRTLSRNETVVDYGSPVLQVYIVECGRFSVALRLPQDGQQKGQGKTAVVSFLLPKAVFGLSNFLQGQRYHDRRAVCESSVGQIYTILGKEFVGYVKEEQRALLGRASQAEDLFHKNRLSVLQTIDQAQHSSAHHAGRRWPAEETLLDRIREIRAQESHRAIDVYVPEGRLHTISLAFQQQLQQEQEQRQQQQEDMLMRLAADQGDKGEIDDKKRSKTVGLKPLWRMEEVVSGAASAGKVDTAMLELAIWNDIPKDGFEDSKISGPSASADANGMANVAPGDGLAAEFNAVLAEKKAAQEAKAMARAEGARSQDDQWDWPQPKRPPDSSMPAAQSTSRRVYSHAMVEFNLRKAQAASQKRHELEQHLEMSDVKSSEVENSRPPSSMIPSTRGEDGEADLETLKEEVEAGNEELDMPKEEVSTTGKGDDAEVSRPSSRERAVDVSRPSSRARFEEDQTQSKPARFMRNKTQALAAAASLLDSRPGSREEDQTQSKPARFMRNKTQALAAAASLLDSRPGSREEDQTQSKPARFMRNKTQALAAAASLLDSRPGSREEGQSQSKPARFMHSKAQALAEAASQLDSRPGSPAEVDRKSPTFSNMVQEHESEDGNALIQLQEEDAEKREMTPTTDAGSRVAEETGLRLPSLSSPMEMFSPELVTMMGSLEDSMHTLELSMPSKARSDPTRPWTVPSRELSKTLPWANDMVHLQQVYTPRRKPMSYQRRSPRGKGWPSTGRPQAMSTATSWM